MIRLTKKNSVHFENYARDRFNSIKKSNPELSNNAIILIMANELQINKKTLKNRLVKFGIIEIKRKSFNFENDTYGRKAFYEKFNKNANLHGVLQMKGCFNENR